MYCYIHRVSTRIIILLINTNDGKSEIHAWLRGRGQVHREEEATVAAVPVKNGSTFRLRMHKIFAVCSAERPRREFIFIKCLKCCMPVENHFWTVNSRGRARIAAVIQVGLTFINSNNNINNMPVATRCVWFSRKSEFPRNKIKRTTHRRTNRTISLRGIRF